MDDSLIKQVEDQLLELMCLVDPNCDCRNPTTGLYDQRIADFIDKRKSIVHVPDSALQVLPIWI